MKQNSITAVDKLLNKLNKEYVRLHKKYEELFWVSYMGDHSVDEQFKIALKERDEFRANPSLLSQVEQALIVSHGQQKIRLKYWQTFFRKYQTPKEVLQLKEKIDALEAKIQSKNAHLKEGYIDPYTKKFVEASRLKMRQMIRTHDDEKIRKACYIAVDKLGLINVDDYVQLVKLRNDFANKLGFKNFYSYKAMTEEGMQAEEIFKLFDEIYDKTKYAFANIRKLEKTTPGLRKPWNFSYLMTGDFTKEEDPYFQFEDALLRWGRSFQALGIDFKGGTLQLDLLDRKGKYPNGFCHYPDIVYIEGKKRYPGSSNFTCTVVPGQVGSGNIGMTTLFHEGGHAADRLNCQISESCMNTEYPPASTAWAETQSMFIDTMYSSIEWRVRYAKNSTSQNYPLELYERIAKKLDVVAPLGMMGISMIIDFEKQIYSQKSLNKKKVIEIAQRTFKKYNDFDFPSTMILYVPHLYSWESACSYHGYGLAEMGLAQWRDYFYDKYGFIVDNRNVGKEMMKVWALGSTKTFKEFIRLATGKNISSKSLVNKLTMSLQKKLALSKARIKRMEKVREFKGKVDLNAKIRMVHGKQVIADNSKGFEKMAEKYALFLHKQATAHK